MSASHRKAVDASIPVTGHSLHTSRDVGAICHPHQSSLGSTSLSSSHRDRRLQNTRRLALTSFITFVLYNPMSLVDIDRIQLISKVHKTHDVLFLPGTGLREAVPGEGSREVQYAYHWGVHFLRPHRPSQCLAELPPVLAWVSWPFWSTVLWLVGPVLTRTWSARCWCEDAICSLLS